MTGTATLEEIAPTAREDDAGERELRHRKLRAAMAADDLDVVIAYGPAWRRENVRYLTDADLTGAATFALLPAEGRVSAFSTRAADVIAMERAGWVDAAAAVSLPELAALAEELRALAPRRVGIAHAELLPLAVERAVRAAVPDAALVTASKLFDAARMVKSEWELTQMRRAARVCALGWDAFVEAVEPGRTEYDVVAAVESEVKRLGAEDNFMLIASGKDEVRGMTPPGRRPIERGDMVRTELTPRLRGYWLQICRSLTVGPASDEQKRSFDLFNEAVEAGMSVVRPGVTCHEVAMAENDVFRRHGYGEYCSSTWTRVRGHGHGLHLDESPIIEGNHTVLPEGAVFIIHPNTFTPIAGYHVLGDPVVVTENGCEVLIASERRLFSSDERSRA